MDENEKDKTSKGKFSEMTDAFANWISENCKALTITAVLTLGSIAAMQALNVNDNVNDNLSDFDKQFISEMNQASQNYREICEKYNCSPEQAKKHVWAAMDKHFSLHFGGKDDRLAVGGIEQHLMHLEKERNSGNIVRSSGSSGTFTMQPSNKSQYQNKHQKSTRQLINEPELER